MTSNLPCTLTTALLDATACGLKLFHARCVLQVADLRWLISIGNADRFEHVFFFSKPRNISLYIDIEFISGNQIYVHHQCHQGKPCSGVTEMYASHRHQIPFPVLRPVRQCVRCRWHKATQFNPKPELRRWGRLTTGMRVARKILVLSS